MPSLDQLGFEPCGLFGNLVGYSQYLISHVAWIGSRELAYLIGHSLKVIQYFDAPVCASHMPSSNVLRSPYKLDLKHLRTIFRDYLIRAAP
jgi:hypothetical protein